MIIADREYIKPLFGMDWLREFIWTILHVEKSTTPNDQSKIDEIIAQFEKQFQRNETNKDPEIKIQLKPGHILKKNRKLHQYYTIYQKQINKVIKPGHLEKVQKVDEICFLSPEIFTVTKDKSVEKALDARKIFDNCTKMRPHMPNMEEPLNQISTEKTRALNDPL